MQYIFRHTVKEIDQIDDDVKREVAEVWLKSRRDWDAPAPTAEEITTAIAEWEAEQAERLDLADLGRLDRGRGGGLHQRAGTWRDDAGPGRGVG